MAADPQLNAVAFAGTVIMAWGAPDFSLWVSANRGISGFVSVVGGWDAPIQLYPKPVAPAVRVWGIDSPAMVFGHMAWCWIQANYIEYPTGVVGGAGSFNVNTQWVSKDFGKTWVIDTVVPTVIAKLPGVSYVEHTTTGVFCGFSSDVDNIKTAVASWDFNELTLFELRDSGGVAGSLSSPAVGVVNAFSGAALFDVFTSPTLRFAGVARVSGGWVVCSSGPGAIASVFVDRWPTLFKAFTNFPTQNVDGIHFGGGERPQVFNCPFISTILGFAAFYLAGTNITDRANFSLDDGQFWINEARNTVNTPKYTVSDSKVVAADALTDDNPIFLQGVQSWRVMEADFVYGGSDIIKMELRVLDTGEGVPSGSTVVQQYVAIGYNQLAHEWYIDVKSLTGLVHTGFAVTLAVGQTYHLQVRIVDLTYTITGLIYLYVDHVLIGSVSTAAIDSEHMGLALNHIGFLMQHSSFPCASSAIHYFHVNPKFMYTAMMPAIVVHGTAGTNTWRYYVECRNAAGEIVGFGTVATTTGNITLSSTNYNVVTWSAVPTAVLYNVYVRPGAAGHIASLATGPFTLTDDGSLTPTGADIPPIVLSNGNSGVEYLDSFDNFIGTMDLEKHVANSGQSWVYGRPRHYLPQDPGGGATPGLSTGYVMSHNSVLGAPGVLVSEPCLSPCQKVSLDFTVDNGHGPCLVEVRARCNNLVAPDEDFSSFGYVFGSGTERYYLYRSSLLGSPKTSPITLVNGSTHNIRIEVDTVSVRGYVDNVLLLTETLLPVAGNGFVGFTLSEGAGCLTKVKNFVAVVGCKTLTPLPAPMAGLARSTENALAGMFYAGGPNNVAMPAGNPLAGKYYMGWSGDKGRTWTTMPTPFALEPAVIGTPHVFPASQKRLVPIENGNVAVVWVDSVSGAPKHLISRASGKDLPPAVAPVAAGGLDFSVPSNSQYLMLI